MQGVDGPQYRQHGQQQRVGRLFADQAHARQHQAQGQGVAGQDDAVAEALDKRACDGLGEHRRRRQWQHAHAGFRRRIAQRHLQQQRYQERQCAAAQARKQIAQDPHGKGARLEQHRREQRVIDMPGAQPVRRQAGKPAEQQQYHAQMRQVQFAQAFHGDGDQHHRRAEQQKAQAVEARALAAAQVGDEFPHGVAADHAHRQVDQEDPVPGQVLHHPAAHCRAKQGAEQAWNSDEAHDPHQLGARISPQYHQPSDRQHQRTAQALDHPCAHQHAQATGQRTQQRPDAEQHDRAKENFLGAKAVSDPARRRNQQGNGEHVGDHHPLHAQRVFREVLRHGR